jgi:flagellar hook assembly protein FlgD
LLPAAFTLEQNYPNPFNPTTSIRFSLPVRSEVSLQIYNLLGQEVKTVFAGELPAGTHTQVWDGTNDANNRVTSGVYFYRLTYGGQSTTKKMTLIK